MHEILAPLIFVLRQDHNAYDHVKGEPDFDISLFKPEIVSLVDEQYFEHDAYAMFCRVMRVVEPWYSSAQLTTGPRFPESQPALNPNNPFNTEVGAADVRKEDAPKPSGPPRPAPPSRKLSISHSAEKEILARLQHIHSGLLREIDPPLFQHLERLDVAPQLYGIRWVRLLFGREFTIQDLLVLWDVIFSHDSEFALVDYVFVAMLIYVRDLLLHGDFSSCLNVVMRYPPSADVVYLVQSALYLSNPGKYPRPPPSQPLPLTLQNNTVVGTSRPATMAETSSISPSQTTASELFDQAGSFFSRGFNTIQKKLEDLDQSPGTPRKGQRPSVVSNSSSSSSIKISRFIPDAILSGAKAVPSSNAVKLVDKFLSGNDNSPRLPPRNLPKVPQTIQQRETAQLNAVCTRALSDLDAALSDLNLLRPVLQDPRHAQVAADIAQKVTAARNSLQVLSGRPLVASSSSSASSTPPMTPM